MALGAAAGRLVLERIIGNFLVRPARALSLSRSRGADGRSRVMDPMWGLTGGSTMRPPAPFTAARGKQIPAPLVNGPRPSYMESITCVFRKRPVTERLFVLSLARSR